MLNWWPRFRSTETTSGSVPVFFISTESKTGSRLLIFILKGVKVVLTSSIKQFSDEVIKNHSFENKTLNTLMQYSFTKGKKVFPEISYVYHFGQVIAFFPLD